MPSHGAEHMPGIDPHTHICTLVTRGSCASQSQFVKTFASIGETALPVGLHMKNKKPDTLTASKQQSLGFSRQGSISGSSHDRGEPSTFKSCEPIFLVFFFSLFALSLSCATKKKNPLSLMEPFRRSELGQALGRAEKNLACVLNGTPD